MANRLPGRGRRRSKRWKSGWPRSWPRRTRRWQSGRRVRLRHLGDAPDNQVEVVVEFLLPGGSGRGERETVSWQALPERAAEVSGADAQAVIRDVLGLSGEHGWMTQAARAALERDWMENGLPDRGRKDPEAGPDRAP